MQASSAAARARLGATAGMGAGAEPLFRIIADGAVELEAQVAEVELPGLKVGQGVSVLPAGAKDALAGTIRLIAPRSTRPRGSAASVSRSTATRPSSLGSFARGMIETGRKTGSDPAALGDHL